MKVLLAEHCGFCPGVKNAIDLASEALRKEEVVYSLGHIIHNDDEVQRLAKLGLKTVETIDEIPGGTVIIRSHGAAPEQVDKLKEKGLKIIDATCVLVKKAQLIARQLEEQGYRVIVIGDRDHPEVKAISGGLGEAVVVADSSDLDKLFEENNRPKLPVSKKLGLVAQTTQSLENFRSVLVRIAEEDLDELKVVNTLCREAIKRQKSAVQICKKVDIMFVLGGLHSSNTRRLANVCKKYNKETFHLQNWKEFDKSKVLGKKSAGVTAGASTPDWVISDFVEHLKALENE